MNNVNQGSNKYCGPAVLSILTGKDTDECVRAIRSVDYAYGGREVKIGDLVKVINKLGMQANLIPELDGASLFATFHNISLHDGMYLILVPRHVVCAEVTNGKILFCDNHTKTPISAENSARLGQRALQVYRIIEIPKPTVILTTLTARPITKTYDVKILMSDGSEHTDYFTITCVGLYA